MASWDLDSVQSGQLIRSEDIRNASNDWQGDVDANGNAIKDAGSLELSEIAEPDTPDANKAVLYIDSTSSALTIKKDSGTVVNLETSPVQSVFGRTGIITATEGDYSLGQLSDVSLGTPAAGQALFYGGSSWGAGYPGNVFGGTSLTTAGAIPYVSAAGTLSQDQTSNEQLFWSSTNHRLGIGTASPTGKIHVTGASGESNLLQINSDFTTPQFNFQADRNTSSGGVTCTPNSARS